ncbi:hypothetical protein GCM10010372_55830 [Streptomyces tauricus]|nr:hypothetical protein GCM10010372_55830 [Streptomyces tauricus]
MDGLPGRLATGGAELAGCGLREPLTRKRLPNTFRFISVTCVRHLERALRLAVLPGKKLRPGR